MKYRLSKCKYIKFMYNGVERVCGVKLTAPFESKNSMSDRRVIIANIYFYDDINNMTHEELYDMIKCSYLLENCTDYNISMQVSYKRLVILEIDSTETSDIIKKYLESETGFVYGEKLLSKQMLNVFKRAKVYANDNHFELNLMYMHLSNEIFGLFVNDKMVSTDCRFNPVSLNFDHTLAYNNVSIYFK